MITTSTSFGMFCVSGGERSGHCFNSVAIPSMSMMAWFIGIVAGGFGK